MRKLGEERKEPVSMSDDERQDEALVCIECPNKDECDHYGSPHLDHGHGSGHESGHESGGIFEMLGSLKDEVLSSMIRQGRQMVKKEYMKTGTWPPDMPEELKGSVLEEIEKDKKIAEKRMIFSRLLTRKMEIAISVNNVPADICSFFLDKMMNGLVRRLDLNMEYDDPKGLCAGVMEEFEDFSKTAMFDETFLEKVLNMFQRAAFSKSQNMGDGVKMELQAFYHPVEKINLIISEVDQLQTLADFQAYSLAKVVRSQEIAKEIHALHILADTTRPGKLPFIRQLVENDQLMAEISINNVAIQQAHDRMVKLAMDALDLPKDDSWVDSIPLNDLP